MTVGAPGARVAAAGGAKASGYFAIQANEAFTAADGVRVEQTETTVRG